MAESASTPVNVGGYPKDIFTEEPDHEYFYGLVLKDPVQTFCGHRFRIACIESHGSSGERCKQCEKEGNEDEYSLIQKDQHHVSNCLYLQGPCPECKNIITLNDLKNHRATECPQRAIKRKLCKAEIKFIELEYHDNIVCPKATINCPVCGEKFEREMVDKDERNSNDRLTAVERQLVDVTNRLGTIDHRTRQALETQQGANNEKFHQLKVKTGTFERIVSALYREIEKLIAATNLMERNRRGMNETMEQKIRTLERTLAVKDVAIAELKMRDQSSEFASYDGVSFWKVSEFNKKQHDAMQGRSISIYSPPFFTSRRGYKMCARLYPNGDGMGKGSHLSLFFVVMRGHYDALQHWPFKQRVTFCLVDQDGNGHVMDSFRPDPSSSSFERPTSDMNIASGFPLFLRLENLQNSNNGFLRDDTLFVKIMVDLNDPPLSEPLKTVGERINVSEYAPSCSM